MNIGGMDLDFKINLSPIHQALFDYKSFIIGHIIKMWPDLTIEDLEENEFFVYKNSACQNRWKELGLADETFNTMIHVIRENEYLTVVVDNLAGEMLDFFVDLIKSDYLIYVPKTAERKLMFYMSEEINKEIDKEILSHITNNK